MTAIGRYVLLTLRLFVRQWSARGFLVGVLSLPMLLMVGTVVLWHWEPEILGAVGAYGYAVGRSLRGRSTTPDRAVGLVGFPLPISPRARWMGGLIASGALGLVLFGGSHALGPTLIGTRHGEGVVRPLGISMLAYLPWAGAAFLGREGLGVRVMLRLAITYILWLGALRWLTPSVQILGLWSAVLVAAAFLVAPRWERLESSVDPGSRGTRSVPGLGARPLSPLLAWGRALTSRPVLETALASTLVMALSCLGLAYFMKGSDAGFGVMLGSYLVLSVGYGMGLPSAVQRPWSPLAPAALLPLPAASLWRGTLLGAVPSWVLMMGAWVGGALGAAVLFVRPIDPAPYAAILARGPLLLAAVLFARASLPLGFLLPVGKRAVVIGCGFAAYVAVAFPPEWGPSGVHSSIALVVSVALLAALTPRRYRAPA